MQQPKSPVGRPKKLPTCKPSLRIDAKLWKEFLSKYPKQSNRMFKEWVEEKVNEEPTTQTPNKVYGEIPRIKTE